MTEPQISAPTVQEVTAVLQLARSAPLRNMDHAEAYGVLINKVARYFENLYRPADEAATVPTDQSAPRPETQDEGHSAQAGKDEASSPASKKRVAKNRSIT